MTVSRRLRFEILRRDNHTCRYCGARAPDVALTVDHVIPTALGGSDEPANLVTACQPCNAGKSSIPADAALVDDVAADALRWGRAIERARVEFAAERQVMDGLLDEFLEAWNGWTYQVRVEVPPEPLPPTGNPLIDNWWQIMAWEGSSAEPISAEDGVLRLVVERGLVRQRRKAATEALDKWSAVVGVELTEVAIEVGKPNTPPRPPQATHRQEARTVLLPPNWCDSVERFLSLGVDLDHLRHLIGVAMRRQNIDHVDRFRFFCGCAWNAVSDLQESARRILEERHGEE